MVRQIAGCFAALIFAASPGYGHASPTPLPVPPLRTRGSLLVDANNQVFLLRGVQIPGLNAVSPTSADLEAIRAMTPLTFRIIQQRWNMNAVRLPVNPAIWRRDGPDYLNRISAIVRSANQEGLIVVLAAFDESTLPGQSLVEFWRACGAMFKNTPGLILDVFNEPSVREIPGSSPSLHRPTDWRYWQAGGALANGEATVGMQAVVDAIRATGARQIVAVPSFHDALEFQSFRPEYEIRDPDILYEVHPYYDHGLSDSARDTNFGFLAGRLPVYAGEWGIPLDSNRPACSSVPADVVQANELVLQTLAYFDARGISWTAADFRPASLIQEFTNYSTTVLDRAWSCGQIGNVAEGIGSELLLWMTGDPSGFGSIAAGQTASAAGGAALPVAPGQIVSLYGQLLGPRISSGAQLDTSGRIASTLAETQVFFDGIAAPVLLAGYFQVNVQVPYELAGRSSSTVQLIYRGVPSNTMNLALVEAAPGLFTASGSITEAAVLNPDGVLNSRATPAGRGAVVVLFGTGSGQTSPPQITGAPAQSPYAAPILPLSLSIGGRPAELLFGGAAPGLVGVTQVNARIPADIALSFSPQATPVLLNIGGHVSRSEVTIWVK